MGVLELRSVLMLKSLLKLRGVLKLWGQKIYNDYILMLSDYADVTRLAPVIIPVTDWC